MHNNEVKTRELVSPPKKEHHWYSAFTSMFPGNIAHYPEYCVHHYPHIKEVFP